MTKSTARGADETPATRPETGVAPVDVAAPVQDVDQVAAQRSRSVAEIAAAAYVRPMAPARPQLPTCGGPATLRLEIAEQAGSTVAAAVMVCSGDLDAVTAAIEATGRVVTPWAGVDPPSVCGMWVDGAGIPVATPTGTPGPLPAAAPVPVAGQRVAQPARVQMSRARVLRLVSDMCYAADRPALPAPDTVRFLHGTETVVITCGTVAEAAAWAAEIDATPANEQRTIVDGQPTHLYTAAALWRGSAVVVSASVPLRPMGAAA